MNHTVQFEEAKQPAITPMIISWTIIIAGIVCITSVLLSANFLTINISPFRHFAFLVSLGKIPGFNILSNECTAENQMGEHVSANACLDDEGKFYRLDANHNVTLFRQILEAYVKKSCPVVIEHPFSDDKCMDRLILLGENKTHHVRYKDNFDWLHSQSQSQSHQQGADVRWFEEDHVASSANVKGDIVPLGDILKELKSENCTRKHLSFDRSLLDSYKDIYGYDLQWLGGISASNFMSNYNSTMVTSPMHSAMFDSFAYQCVGRKTWRFLPPADNMKTVLFFGTGFTLSQNCNNRPDILKRTIEVVVDADSMLYFPPYWGHSVRTDKGLSVLLNYRKLDVLGMLRRGDVMLALHSVIGILLQVTYFVGRDAPEIAHYYTKGNFHHHDGDGDAQSAQSGEPSLKKGLTQATPSELLQKARIILGLV